MACLKGNFCSPTRKPLQNPDHVSVIQELFRPKYSASVFFPLIFLALLAIKRQTLTIQLWEGMGIVLMFCAFMLQRVTPRDGHEVDDGVLSEVTWLCSSPCVIVSLV